MTSHIHEHKQIGFFVIISHFVMRRGWIRLPCTLILWISVWGGEEKHKRPTWKLCLGDWDMICGGKLYINKHDRHEKPMNGCRGQ